MSLQLECVDCKCMPTTAMFLPSPNKITSLSQELLDQILSNLSKQDLQAAVCVSRGVSQRVKAVANFNGPHSIKNFILMLTQKLNAKIFLTQRERLAKIAENIIPCEFSSLLMLKNYILAVELELVSTIKSLYLNNVEPPHFIEDVFELVRFEIQIDEANSIPDELRRENKLRNISEALAQAGKINRAIEVAQSMNNKSRIINALWGISKVLAQAGKINRAIEVIKLIHHEYTRSDALRDIAKILTQAGKINRAIEVAKSIDNEYTRSGVLESIRLALIEAGKIIKAEEVGKLIGRCVTYQEVIRKRRQPNDWSIKELPNKAT